MTITKGFWRFISGEESISAGHRPGGTNRSPLKASNSASAANISQPVYMLPSAAVISERPQAVTAEGGDRNMSAADLQYIRDLYAEASGLWETEIDFEAVALPWLQKGSILQITGHTDEDGSEIPLGHALVYQLDSEFDPTESKRAVASARAVFWSTEGQG